MDRILADIWKRPNLHKGVSLRKLQLALHFLQELDHCRPVRAVANSLVVIATENFEEFAMGK